MNAMAPHWVQTDGAPVSCTEKLRMLDANRTELAQMMQDAFEDAILMDVDEACVRAAFSAMIARLKSPRA